MANETAMVHPSNKIVLDSTGIHLQTKKVETATNMYPGRLVEVGTNDDDVVVGTAGGDVYGWLGYEQTSKKYRPATVDTIYSADDQATVINGSGIIVVASLGFPATVTKGERLTSSAAGEVTPGTAGTDDIVAIAEEAKTTTSASADILVRSLI